MKKSKREINVLTAGEENLISGAQLAFIAFIPLIAIIFSYVFKITDNETSIRPLIKLSIAACAGVALLRAYKGKLSTEKILMLIIAAGLIMRVGYMLYTNWTQRTHDVGFLDETGNGHGAYIVNNILQGHLPDSNDYQFYHPPLYYMLSGLAIKVISIFTGNSDYASLIKYAMSVSCAASCVSLVIIQRLMDELKIERKYQIPAVAIAAFFPNFILMGGRVNNDSLVTMFMILSVYFTVRWYYKTDVKNIIGIALSVGLGMMTKVSCGTVAIFIAPIMLYKLYMGYKNKELVSIIKQLAVFAVICFPIALWYPIRNYILFGQELNFVHYLGTGSFVYTGNIPAIDRFFTVPLFEEFDQQFMDPGEDYSIFMIVTRTAIFGEWDYENVSNIVSVTLYYINLIMIALSLVSAVYVCIKEKGTDLFSRFSMAALWVIIFVSYIVFNISYPFSCTADMRYIPLTLVAGIVYLAKGYAICDGMSSVKVNWLVTGGKCLVAAYCVWVFLMYA